MKTLPLEHIFLLDLEGKQTHLQEHTRDFLLLIFLRHLA
jgi:hypothetical protein